MRLTNDSYIYRVISGEARGVGAAVLRGVLRIGEVFYAGAMAVRNKLYDSKILKSHKIGISVISIGNITAGGTGKTPMVRYLAAGLAKKGFHPAILMRGYHRGASGMSDEQQLLAEQLGELKIPVHANPDRVAGGREILKNHPQTNVIVLDDGFQHRRLFRDLNIVLVDATNPFGFGHVHPRGLLRESLGGLGRADVFLLTRCEQVTAAEIEKIEPELSSSVPILRVDFKNNLDALRGRKIFAAAAIANPGPLEATLKKAGDYRGHWWFADHHDFTAGDVVELRRRATAVGAEVIVVTEKDWVKIRSLPGAVGGSPEIVRIDLGIEFPEEGRLWELLGGRLGGAKQEGAADADD